MLATALGVPVFVILVIGATLGDCAWGVDCKRSLVLTALLPTLLVVVPIGLIVRLLVNNRWNNH